MKYMGLKLGPVLKLCNIIEKLRSRLKWRWAESIMLIFACTIQTFNHHLLIPLQHLQLLANYLHASLSGHGWNINAVDIFGMAVGHTAYVSVPQLICVDKFRCSVEHAMNDIHNATCVSVSMSVGFLCFHLIESKVRFCLCSCLPAHMWIHIRNPATQAAVLWLWEKLICLRDHHPHRQRWWAVDDSWWWIVDDNWYWWAEQSSPAFLSKQLLELVLPGLLMVSSLLSK